jgi:Fe-S cluster assembly iron-binding protein IscA
LLYLSDRAGEDLKQKLTAAANPDLRFRVFIDRLCNCGRPRFGLRLEQHVADSDTSFEVGGVPFVADKETLPKLRDAEIDYADNWMRRGVAIRNIDECGSCVDA